MGKEGVAYQFLVGADGATSLVRRYLKLKQKYTIGIYYDIPDIKDNIILNIDGKSLKTGYIWEFPHQTFTNVGIHYHPKHINSRKALALLRSYMQQNNYPIDSNTYRAFPIAYGYYGCQFKHNIFLAGDAAGLASKLTGEGIAYALISGREVARTILNPSYKMPSLRRLIAQKKKQHRIVNFFERIPIGLNVCFFLFLNAYKVGLINMQEK
jgi:geranylgeranyl reductase